MILEVAILNIRPGESADFERAFAEAQAISAARAGYGWGVQRMGEADTCYAVLRKRTRAVNEGLLVA